MPRKTYDKNLILERACMDFGGQGEVAKALGVTQGLVNQWVLGRTRITAERALELVKLFEYKIRPEDLCREADWSVARKLP
jgi:DNA-binding transcriptional regulator YdaS (Cro superfamily)